MTQASILVVDDEQDIRQLVSEILEDEGYSVTMAENGESARAAFASAVPDLVLLDIWMPDVDGITLLKEWSESGRLSCPVVMISGHGTLETAVEATRLGAHDFVQKPLSLAKLLATVKQALATGSQAAAPGGVSGPVAEAPQGSSPQVQLLRRAAEQAARSSAALLISGEHGSGKETLAAYIHELSDATGPLVLLDAVRLRADDALGYLVGGVDIDGALQQAAHGSLFIPELLSLEEPVQALLADIFEAGSFTPGDSAQATALSARIIAGISIPAERAVEEGLLLKRLYLCLSVLPLQVPPLRERPQDVPDLVNYYVDKWSNNEGLTYRHFSISALNRLRNHDWPGNETELANLVKRFLVLGGEGEIAALEVDEALREQVAVGHSSGGTRPVTFDLPLREAREAFERDYLIYQLKKAGGSVGKLSESVGMERTHLYRKLRSLGIDPKKVVAGVGS